MINIISLRFREDLFTKYLIYSYIRFERSLRFVQIYEEIENKSRDEMNYIIRKNLFIDEEEY